MTVGEPITYVTTVGNGQPKTWRQGLARGRVEKIFNDAVFMLTKNGSPFLYTFDEGIRWVRGHHTEQSAEGQALLAACALNQAFTA